MKNLLKKLVVEDQGQDVIEYALLAAGISIVVIPFAPRIGDQLERVYGLVEGAVTQIGT